MLHEVTQEKVEFTNRKGQSLAGILHTPANGAQRATALFAHCFTCTKNIMAAVHIANALAVEGFAVLRFDFTGLGDSEGDFADTHFSANVHDLLDAAGWLEQQDMAPQLLVGHSLGGTAVLAAATALSSVRAVATIGSPADAEHILHLLEDDLDEIKQSGAARVRLAGRPFTIRQDFVDDVRNQSVRDGVRQLRRALLVMHSPIDELVSIDEASRIYSSAMHPKSFISLDDADHLLTRKEDSLYAGRALAAWASRYVPLDEPDHSGAADAALTPTVAGAVVVGGAKEEGFRVTINAGGHRLVGDEPESYGGTDLGPTPYDFLGAALGACTVMTLNFFARRESLPLTSARVDVSYDRVHFEDCDHCETKQGKIDRLTRKIYLDGQLDQEQRELLLKIADRCPVHKTLLSETIIENKLMPTKD